MGKHQDKVLAIQKRIQSYLASGDKRKIIFEHGSSNSTRYHESAEFYTVDLSDLGDILEINEEKKYIVVEPNVPMDKLLAYTLKYNLMPPVVPEFPGITVGGAVQGGSGESGSFKYGEFHNSCFKYEMILGNGDIVTASATENLDLFSATDSSYGSFGIMTSVSILLIPAPKYVELTYYPVKSFEELVAGLAKFDKEDEEWLDAIMYSPTNGVIMVGRGADSPDKSLVKFLKASDPWFAQHAAKISKKAAQYTERIPVPDYIFRYDRGVYWMGDFFFNYYHLPNTRFLRWLFNPMFDTRTLFLGLQKARLAKEFFIQDICFPIEHATKFFEFLDESMGIYPLWICPLKPATKEEFLCSHSQETELVLNVGIWGRTQKYLDAPMQKNRDAEQFSNKFGARKVLYAHQYYPPEEFWTLYDKERYDQLREKYHATTMFPDVYSSTHVSKLLDKDNWTGFKAVAKHVWGKLIH